MAEHVPQNSDEGLWLPLTEYAVRSGISTSTIRRKIKSHSIRFRVDKGKYLIFFDPHLIENHEESFPNEAAMGDQTPKMRRAPVEASINLGDSSASQGVALPLMEKVVNMVSEAFEHSLHEKDQRISLLEHQNHELQERLDELKTLVQVLEEKYDVHY